MTLCIAHRGEPVGHRENTLPAFAAACRAGADMVELDCRLTRDGHVVVLHDRALTRLWGRDQQVDALELSEVTALGHGDERIPDLATALEVISTPVMVDVEDPGVVPAVLEVVTRAGAFGRSLFAGSLEGLRWLRRERPDARLALSWDRPSRPGEGLLDELRPEFFNPRYDLFEDSVASQMHERGLGVCVWTVDDAPTMLDLVKRGVDAIITNRIGLLVGTLRGGGGLNAL